MNRIERARVGLAGVALTLCLVLVGCGGDTHPQVPTTFSKSAGDNQSSAAGVAIPVAPAVTILDADGKGISGIAVTFALVNGGGTLTGTTATTDANGVAKAGSWVLGTALGVNTITAAAVNVPGSPVTFTATAVAGPPATITKSGPDPVKPPLGSNVSITAKLTDQFGNPVSGATITFAVTAGGGSVSPATATTAADGTASALWTVGLQASTANSATATRTGIASPTVTFNTITGRVTAVRFTAKTFIVDSLATFTPGVSAFDFQGNAVTDDPITLTLRSTAVATISGATVTGLRTGQTFLIGASTENPSATDSALVVVANVASPVLVATVPRFDLKTDTTFTVPITIDMRAPGAKLGAATIQITWDPTVLTYLSNADGASSVGATVNATAVATGSLTLALASNAGFSGAVEIRKLTFKASAVVGRSGSLALVATDLNAAVTLNNLLPKTVTSFYPFKTR